MDDKPDTSADKPKGEATYKQAADMLRQGWIRLTDKIESILQQYHTGRKRRRAKREEETTEAKAARLTARATLWIALLTGAVVLIAAIQLYEIIEGGKDTTAIADAAKKQVYAANRNADAAQRFADTAALINGGIGDAVKKLDAQSRATQETARIVISGNRPWIVPDPPPQSKNSLAEAILDWHNAGQSPAVDVFSYPEYFIGEIPKKVRTCRELERDLKKKRIDAWQYQSFVDKGARYQVGLSGYPEWVGQSPIGIHGCIWYRDVLSNTQRTTEFFYIAFQGKLGYPKHDGIGLFYLADRPIVYR